jgi:prevent-host-death family protein
MDEKLSVTQAKRRFHLILQSVREGRSYEVTSRGRPIARIIPAVQETLPGARAALLARLAAQPIVHARPWTRDELYEDKE